MQTPESLEKKRSTFRRSISLSLSPSRQPSRAVSTTPTKSTSFKPWEVDPNIIKQGTLLKLVDNHWEKRWFRLLTDYLVFYRRQPPSEEGLSTALMLGIIPVKGCEIRDVPCKEPMSPDDPQESFVLSHGDINLQLGATSSLVYLAWKNALDQAIHLTTRRSVSIPRTSSLPSENWEIPFEELVFLEKIGDGEFGQVFRGRLWGTDVAIKQLRESTEELVKEIEILRELRHPNVILYIGACPSPQACIVTEYCKFGNLYELLHVSDQLLDMQTIINIAVGIAQGMNYLHSLERKIIHRDLKSHNILVSNNFTAKVADFGLSHVRKSINDGGKDGHYGIFGTPEWMAPEVMMGLKYSEKIDIYSFGIVLSELLCRELPFHDQYQINGYTDVVDAVIDDHALPTVPSWAGSRMKALIHSCLRRDPEKRPSFEQVLEQLRTNFLTKAMSNPDKFFERYDIPRIMSLLLSAKTSNNERAAAEISSRLLSGGNVLSSLISDRSALSLMIVRFGTLLSRDVWRLRVDHSVPELDEQLSRRLGKYLQALKQLIELCSEEARAAHRSALKEEGGLRALLTLLGTTDPGLKGLARNVVSVLIDDLSPSEQIRFVDLSYRDLGTHDVNGLSALKEIVEEEIVGIEDQVEMLHELAANKRTLSKRLGVALAIMKTEFNKRGPPLGISRQVSLGSSINSPLSSPTNEKFPDGIPEPWREYFGDSDRVAIASANILEDEIAQKWIGRVLLLFGDVIHIFESENSEPDDAIGVFHLRTRKGQSASADLCEFPRRPNCLCLHNGSNDPLVFSMTDRRHLLEWAYFIDPSNYSEPPVQQISDHPMLDEEEEDDDVYETGLGLSVVMEEVKELSEEFIEYFGDGVCACFGTLALKMGTGLPWRTVFGLITRSGKSGELRLYTSPSDAPDDAWAVIYLSSQEGTRLQVLSAELEQSDWKSRTFVLNSIDQSFLFCVRSRIERKLWMSQLLEFVQLPE